jgi:site-specific DNA-cytosine methylase
MQLELSFPDFKHTYAEFFAGCGGLSLGFEMAGLKCISALEFNPQAANTFYHNLCYAGWTHVWIDPEDEKTIKAVNKWDRETSNYLFPNGVSDNWLKSKEPTPCLNLFVMDILKLEPEVWMELCGVRPGDVRIFSGGPPCQGFSTSNTNRNMLDERNQLPLRFIYYCKVCKPEIVMMENVPGIVSLGKKKGEKEGPFIHWIRDAFNEAGYDMEYKILNAADYGVPQNRKRVIFIAIRKGFDPGFKWPEASHGERLEPFVSVRECIGSMPPIEAGSSYDGEPYFIKKEKGHVLCFNCHSYVKDTRSNCQICGYSTTDAITGGILKAPNMGITMVFEKENADIG